MPLDRENAAGDPAHDRSSVAGAGADLQHAVGGLQLSGFDHDGYYVGLRDRLAFADRQWTIFVREFLEAWIDERFPRHSAEGPKQRPVSYAARCDLCLDHTFAAALGHGIPFGQRSGLPPVTAIVAPDT